MEDSAGSEKRSSIDGALANTVASSPEATIHASRQATLLSRITAGASSRELPKISIVLRGSLSAHTDSPLGVRPSEDRDIEVLSTLGEGGMGRVFLARQHSLDREVAIKTVRDTASETERAALLSEGAITGHLEHPGIIPVHALGVDGDGRPVLVMKRVEGVEWSVLLDEPTNPIWDERGGKGGDRLDDHLEILLQVCDAAHFAHSRGIVHRDIKPQNIFIGRYREVYLGDWGLAVRADIEPRSATLCGTPAFMAPEMARGDKVDARTDVYLLGATLHRILTGDPRHTGENIRAAVSSALDSVPVEYPDSVPAELGAIANRATSRDPAARAATAAALRQEIADYLRHKGSIALGHSARERLAKLRDLSRESVSRRDTGVQHQIDLVIAEVRFALREALIEWSDNPVAKDVARELDELMVARRARVAELERLAEELDPTIARRQRALTSAALALTGVALSVSSFVVDRHAVTPEDILLESLAPLAIALTATVVFRRQLLRTILNRRAVISTIAVIGGITADRALGVVAGESTAKILMHDCLLAAALAFAGIGLLFRWVGWVGVVMLGGAVVAATCPEQAVHAFSVASGLGLVLAVSFAWTTGR